MTDTERLATIIKLFREIKSNKPDIEQEHLTLRMFNDSSGELIIYAAGGSAQAINDIIAGMQASDPKRTGVLQ